MGIVDMINFFLWYITHIQWVLNSQTHTSNHYYGEEEVSFELEFIGDIIELKVPEVKRQVLIAILQLIDLSFFSSLFFFAITAKGATKYIPIWA